MDQQHVTFALLLNESRLRGIGSRTKRVTDLNLYSCDLMNQSFTIDSLIDKWNPIFQVCILLLIYQSLYCNIRILFNRFTRWTADSICGVFNLASSTCKLIISFVIIMLRRLFNHLFRTIQVTGIIASSLATKIGLSIIYCAILLGKFLKV